MSCTVYYLLNMSVFCLLWMPFFYLFWRAVTGYNSSAGGVWALLVGSVIAMVQFFLGYLVEPGGFGLSRWMSGIVDIVALPVLLPLFICFFLANFKVIPGSADFTNFTLLWLIPGGAIRTLSWGSFGDPILLVMVPILWTAIAVGIPFFINIIQKSRNWYIFPAFLAILAIPCAASGSYWAFYAQRAFLGLLGFFIAVTPMLISVTLSFVKTE